MSVRTCVFVDGFNLYHAISDLGRNHLKWLNLRQLSREFAPSPVHEVGRVLYFSAYAKWLPAAYSRHQEYVRALEAMEVEPLLSRFKRKDRGCRSCGNRWKSHEEKETDVSIGVNLLDAAYQDEFDQAFLVSADSDLVRAVQLVRKRFPRKTIRILTPPGRQSSRELIDASGQRSATIRVLHLERCLLPQQVRDKNGTVVAKRPPEYDPP